MHALRYSRIGILALGCLARATDQPDGYQPMAAVQEMVNRGQYSEAERAFQDLRKSGALANDAKTGVFADILGVAMLNEGQYLEADTLISDGIAILTTVAPGDVRLARTWSHLAEVRWGQRRLAEAQTLCERALRVQKRALGSADPEVITTLTNLAAIHRELGQFDAAKGYLKEALAADAPRREESPVWRAAALHNLACLYLATGKPRAARESLLEALGVLQWDVPADRQEMVYVISSLGAAETHLKQYRSAESSLQRAAALARLEFRAGHPTHAAILVNLAAVQEALHLNRLAEQSLRSAATIQAEALGPENPELARTMLKHALVLAKLGRRGEAQALEDTARAILARESAEELRVSIEQLKKNSK